VPQELPLRLPEGVDHDRALGLFTERPEAFMAGPARSVTAPNIDTSGRSGMPS